MRDVRTFHRDDWNAFTGAEAWSTEDDAQPIISITENNLVLADRNSVLAMIEGHPQTECGGWGLDIAFPTQAMARAFISGLPQDFDVEYLTANGFEEH